LLGISLVPPAQSGEAAIIDQVMPGHSGEKLGLRKGDVIVELGGRPLQNRGGVLAYTSTLTAGAPVDVKVKRGGKIVRLRGKSVPRPLESYRGAKVDYGAVPFSGGRLRDLLVMPEGVAQPPVLFLIQGFSCVSVESPDPKHSYRRLGDELIARGIAYYRVEKPGIGDSAGTPNCAQIDYATELDAFRTAYRHLVEVRGADPDRIFMLGHSLGGLQAPMLAAERPPRGVAVYGTGLRNWADYHQDLNAIQPYLFEGQDPGKLAEAAARSRDMLRLFYFERKAPREIAASKPEFDAAMRELMSWDGGDRIFGRHYKYAQDLAHQPLHAAWRNTRSNVLALYGESDVVALFDTDHKLIADIANWFRPGSGRYVEVAATGHGMDRIGNRFEVREKTIAAGAPPTGEFNPEVAEALAGWIKDSMAKPPVRTLPERVLPAAPASAP
jgi:pimeloyl-ACP methyl ester carboxylesterase